MTTTIERHQDWYRPHFENFERTLNGASGTAVHAERRKAFSTFLELGFPTTRDEEWRFTNVAPLAASRFQPVPGETVAPIEGTALHRFMFGGLRCNRLVFVDGKFNARLSATAFLPPGVIVGSLADAIRVDPALVERHLTRLAGYRENAFTALNTSFLQDGACVQIPDGVSLPDPVHLLFVATTADVPRVSHPRNLIVAGAGSRLALAESYVHLGGSGYFTNAVTEIEVGRDAVVEHDTVQQEADDAYHIGTIHVHQDAGSRYTANAFSFGGLLVRNTVQVVLDGSGADCTLNGLSLGTREQLTDNHTAIDHARPGCTSHELYKAVLDGRSRGVFNGKIVVRKDAQKTDAKQTNRTLLLSDDAIIDTKPQLEIFADDVKCTHGATVGALDEEQVFYLRSRGMGLAAARDLLTFAFAGEVINRVHMEPLRVQLENLLHHLLREGRVATGTHEDRR
jgi:Fe-S cluster assembly protein SufD